MPIRLHWSFPLLVVLALVPSGSRFEATTFLEGLGWLAALFCCILIHELSHCFVARHRGFTVRDVVLLPIGGASEISGLPGAPSDELNIALAGPLASIALAVGLALAGVVLRVHLWPPTLFAGALLSRLMWANLLLAAFNLVPALPMDGGRVLRALLARQRNDLEATVIAARIGQLAGLAMVFVGIRFDLWLSVIGLFVLVGAEGEKRAAAVRTATGGLKVRDVMVPDATTLEVSFPLSAVAPFLEAAPGRVLPVVDSGRYVGLTAADHLGGVRGGLVVGEVTDRLAPTLTTDEPLYPVAVETLLGGRRRAAAVLEGGRVVGVLYAPHLESALRRAAAGLGTQSLRR